jgi:hypothetical protein
MNFNERRDYVCPVCGRFFLLRILLLVAISAKIIII